MCHVSRFNVDIYCLSDISSLTTTVQQQRVNFSRHKFKLLSEFEISLSEREICFSDSVVLSNFVFQHLCINTCCFVCCLQV